MRSKVGPIKITSSWSVRDGKVTRLGFDLPRVDTTWELDEQGRIKPVDGR